MNPDTMNPDPAQSAVERVARASFGRLVAFLARRTGDVQAAEDAIADAFAAALRTWPSDGVPDKPEAWLLRSAQNRIIDGARRDRARDAALPELARFAQHAITMAETRDTFPDERLAMLFACAHPSLDVGVHTPLMLQAVLGLDANAIASAFLVAPSAMSQRLVRAKQKLRQAGIRIEIPDADELDGRLGAVLSAIYAAYTARYNDAGALDPIAGGIGLEAIELARLMASWMPQQPETLGLLALLLYCEARSRARRGTAGEYVPLEAQNVTRWNRAMIGEAEELLTLAAQSATAGRFQLEAALQSAHVHARLEGRIDHDAVLRLYAILLEIAPSIGAAVGQASAIAAAHGPAAGLRALDAVASDCESYQPAWALRADLLRQLGRGSDAKQAYERAAGLSDDPAVRQFLLARGATCG